MSTGLHWLVIGTTAYRHGAGRWHSLADRWAGTDKVSFIDVIGIRRYLVGGMRKTATRRLRGLHQWEWVGPRLRYRTVLGGYLPALTRLWKVPGVWKANEVVLGRILSRELAGDWTRGCTNVVVNFNWGLSWAVNRAEANLVIYDCSDLFRAYPGESCPRVDWAEGRAAATSDFVVVSSECLRERMLLFARDVLFLPNGADALASTPARACALRQTRVQAGRPVVGYHGSTLNWRFDWGLLRRTAALCPEMEFRVFSDSDPVKTDLPANLRLLPWVDREAIAREVQQFTIGFMPYVMSEPTLSGFPVKFMEFLSHGLPVVSTRLRELERFADFVKLFDGDPQDAAALLRACLAENNTQHRLARITLAEAYSWDRVAARYRVAVCERLAARGLYVGDALDGGPDPVSCGAAPGFGD